MLRNLHPLLVLVLFIAAFQAIGGLLGMITSGSMDPWYNDLIKSPLNPPGYVFGIAWTILYAFLAIALWFIWRAPESKQRSTILMIFAGHMVLNWAWTPVFFGMQAVFPALIMLIVILATAAILCKMMWPVDKRASLLFIPYMAWLTLATHLNFYIWQHN